MLGTWLLITLILVLTLAIIAWFCIPLFKGHRVLSLFLFLLPIFSTYILLMIITYHYPAPLTLQQSLGMGFAAATFISLFLWLILANRLIYAWMDDDEAFKARYSPLNGDAISAVIPQPKLLLFRATFLFIWHQAALICTALLAVFILASWPYQAILMTYMGVAAMMFFDLALIMHFPKCPHCHFAIMALNDKKKCFAESRRLLFKGHCYCVVCNAHYFVSAEKLRRYQASHPTSVSPNSQNIQP